MARKPVAKPRERAYLNVDSRAVMIATSLFLVGLIAVSFTQSFNALVAVSTWTGLPEGLGWTVPVTVDSAILIFTLSALVMHARGQRGGTYYAWVMLLLFTCLSIGANVMHAVDASSGEGLTRMITGAVLAGCAPFLTATGSHMLSLVVIEPATSAGVASPRVAVTRHTVASPKATPAPAVATRPLGDASVSRQNVATSDAGNVATVTPRPNGAMTPIVTAVATTTADGQGAASLVDQHIRDALTVGTRPTGAQIGQWLGGKSPKTGQRYLVTLSERDATVATLLDGVDGASASVSPVSRRDGWAATA